MKCFYFIDAENVHTNGLKGFEVLEEEDIVTIFYSKPINVPDGSFRFSKLKVPGKNAVDFQIVAQLGYLCYQHPHARFVIISKDQGYFSAIAELLVLQPNLEISLYPSIYESFSLFQKDQYALWLNSQKRFVTTEEQKIRKPKQDSSNTFNQTPSYQNGISQNNVIAFHAKDISGNHQKLPSQIKTIIDTLECNEQTKKLLIEDILEAPNKADLHNRLRRHLNNKGVVLYNEIKDCLYY